MGTSWQLRSSRPFFVNLALRDVYGVHSVGRSSLLVLIRSWSVAGQHSAPTHTGVIFKLCCNFFESCSKTWIWLWGALSRHGAEDSCISWLTSSCALWLGHFVLSTRRGCRSPSPLCSQERQYLFCSMHPPIDQVSETMQSKAALHQHGDWDNAQI